MQTNDDMIAQILKEQEQLTTSILLPMTIVDTNAKLRASQREVHELSRKAHDLSNEQKEELAIIATAKLGTSKEKVI
jgi:hypothetical protein